MTMTPEQILAEVTQVFRQVFGNPSITVNETTEAKDIPEWDSLNHTTLIAEVEQHFRIKFSLREIMRFQNVGDMCTILRTKLGS
jgi:acyl carrier protein